ncbi:MAG: hypothetical protein E7513_02610 [Ruminococcaceae bacterium]|nr:hypothetical protein [Oscillospiraceae bacterium]
MKKIFSMLLIVSILITVFTVSVSADSAYASGDYVEDFEAYLVDNGLGPHYEDQNWYAYEAPCYEYFSEANDTDIPDWILAFGAYMGLSPMPCYGVFGDYYIQNGNYLYPYSLGYYVYVPSESKFYTLEEAWEADFEGIENAFTEYLLVEDIAGYIGDADGDNKLSIIDATFIQRTLVGLCVFDSSDDLTAHTKVTDTAELSYVSDIDGDGKRTVLDATAIQRKLAQLDIPVATTDQG